MNRKYIKKVLIINRSEIAIRIIATCKARGLKTVTLFCHEDRFSPHLFLADEAYPLSQNGICGYLDQTEILSIAHKANVDAIHPGYGFLAENYEFAHKVIEEGFIWIGPQPENIKLMGDKSQARKIMSKNNIPIIPGTKLDASKTTLDKASKAAKEIGYPIILKSSLGGGGKAIRKVDDPRNFASAWERVCSESQKLFSSLDIIIEKYITNGRHIEIQVAGDGRNYIHLFERECSIQRRHQKIIEESPCSFVSQSTLKKMYETSIRAIKSINYTNIGTVEFIVTADETFYFLEMNTRLQVEHSVTEATTGIDLVDLQFSIAQNGKLPFEQQEIHMRGHAIECRIYSEDPQNNFSPTTGTISVLHFPTQPFIRYDHALEKGTVISSLFDPMIAKITSFGQTRTHAIEHMKTTLQTTAIVGVTTNILFLQAVLKHQDFLNGSVHTQWLQPKLLDTLLKNKPHTFYPELLATLSASLLSKETTSNNSNKYIKSTIRKRWKHQ